MNINEHKCLSILFIRDSLILQITDFLSNEQKSNINFIRTYRKRHDIHISILISLYSNQSKIFKL